MNLWVIFFTGLTTGGLTCLAIQGGLLATAMTHQTVNTPQPIRKSSRRRSKPRQAKTPLTAVQLPENPLPVVYFLVAKLIAYTLTGFLLGALGSALQITPKVQAVMQIAAGLFMLATALNMFNVHPIFRYVVLQPPKRLTRLVRNQAKSQEVFTPALLGLMTVFIPCGTTQAMEILAISSGNAIWGALIMFVFVLGTSPTFLVLGVLASQLRGKFQQTFALTAAFLILLLSVLSLDTGLKLLGSPLAPSYLLAGLRSSGPPVPATLVNGVQELTIHAYDTRYSPDYFSAQHGQPIRLRLVTDNTYGCTRGFSIPTLDIWQVLPEQGETVIDLPPQRAGNLRFTCSMGMYNGTIVIY
ncbi:MAG: sulfite exporter TauE/SafE family protein [Anaerolineae bacterium]|nr:sulfite exporter TauE/SafE family protein [Anaerolineae bacterium]